MAAILVVDDDQPIVEMIFNALTPAGHIVMGTADGRAALKRIEDGGFDLVVTDIMMPELDGIGLILELNQRKSKIPIVAITGIAATENGHANSARTLGVYRILAKPFHVAELIKVAAEAIQFGNATARSISCKLPASEMPRVM